LASQKFRFANNHAAFNALFDPSFNAFLDALLDALVLVTRNTSDFRYFRELKVENWFEAG